MGQAGGGSAGAEARLWGKPGGMVRGSQHAAARLQRAGAWPALSSPSGGGSWSPDVAALAVLKSLSLLSDARRNLKQELRCTIMPISTSLKTNTAFNGG